MGLEACVMLMLCAVLLVSVASAAVLCNQTLTIWLARLLLIRPT